MRQHGSDGGIDGFFGLVVTLSADGSTALVGQPYQTVNGNSEAGTVYIFTQNSSGYTQTAELTESDGRVDGLFGLTASLTADGNTAMVGDELNANRAGAVYIFTRDGLTYTQNAELAAPDGVANDEFGTSVALNAAGSFALVGAYGHTVNNNSDAGVAYVFGNLSATTSTSVSVTSDTNPSHYGDALTLTATVVPASDRREPLLFGTVFPATRVAST